MYKVFLVEDEERIRSRIRENFDWEACGLQFAGEASDGELALPLIHEAEPDIVITDIKMPFMNGLDLSRVISRKMPWVKIIIISGHDDFDYAREAISIGISEYVLKPVNPAELTRVLKKTAAELDEEKKKISELEEFEKKAKSSLSGEKERFLLETIIYGKSSTELIEKALTLDINFNARFFSVMIFQFNADKDLSLDEQYIELLKLNKLIEQVHSSAEDILTASRNLNETLFIVKSNSESFLEERILNISSQLQKQSEDLISGKVRIGTGRICSRLSELTDSYHGAAKALEYSFLFNNREIMAEEDVTHMGLIDAGLLDLKSDSLFDFLKYNRKEDIGDYLDRYLASIEKPLFKGKFLLRYFYLFTLLAAGRFAQSISADPAEILPELTEAEVEIMSLTNSEELKKKLTGIIERVIEFRSCQNFSKYRNQIDKVKEYIRKNYSKPDMSLQEVADIAHFSACRFSTVFKQETGETFTTFLTKTRVQKAMEYLKTTSKQSSEIAELIGYNDSHYFSYIFKKVNGISPTQFRDSIG